MSIPDHRTGVSRRAIGQIALGTILAGGLAAVPQPEGTHASIPEDAAWTEIPATDNVPSGRWDHTVGSLDSEKGLLVFGGRNADGMSLGDTWMFSRSRNIWEVIDTEGPSPRFGHATAVDQEANIVYLFGGQHGAEFYNDLWAFSGQTQRWTLIDDGSASAPVPRYGTSLAISGDGVLIVSHGFTFEGRFDDTWAFTIESGSWENITPVDIRPLNRCLHEAVWSLEESRMLLFGGCSSGYGPCPQGDFWSFDPERRTWELVSPGTAPAARSNPSLAMDSGRNQLLLFGGLTEAGHSAELWSTDRTRGNSNSWSQTASSARWPSPRSSHDLVVAGPRVWLFGGLGDQGPLNDLWYLDLK